MEKQIAPAYAGVNMLVVWFILEIRCLQWLYWQLRFICKDKNTDAICTHIEK